MPVTKVVVGGKQRGASEKETCLIREWLGERVQQHAQSAAPPPWQRPSSAPAPPQGAPGDSGQLEALPG